VDDVRETSRRSVLRGAVAAGTLAWAAPAVQVIAPAAHAAGTAQPGISYVGLLLLDTATKRFYRVKYEFQFDQVGDVTSFVIEAGPGWNAPSCEGVSSTFYKDAAGLKASDGTLQAGAPPQSVVSKYDLYAKDGGFYVVLPKGVRLFAWVAKSGQCCARQGTYDDYQVCQPDALGAKYTVSYVPFKDAKGNHVANQWLFPAAPNDAGCTTLGKKAYDNTIPCNSSIKPGPLK
jgi:hypothetical protein